MSESYIILLVTLGLALIVRNKSVLIALGILLVLKVLRLNSLIKYIDDNGMEIGLTILMIALLAPIAMGEFGTDKFLRFIKDPLGILAVVIGVLVTILARQGVQLMNENPMVVGMSIVGIIIGVVILKGVSVGPLVASGITAAIYGLVKYFCG